MEKPPEGSLRALGGEGKEFVVPKGLGRACQRILNGTPESAVEAALTTGTTSHNALEWLMKEGYLTGKQKELMRAVLLQRARADHRLQAITKGSNGVLDQLLATRSLDVTDNIRAILKWDENSPGGVDTYV